MDARAGPRLELDQHRAGRHPRCRAQRQVDRAAELQPVVAQLGAHSGLRAGSPLPGERWPQLAELRHQVVDLAAELRSRSLVEAGQEVGEGGAGIVFEASERVVDQHQRGGTVAPVQRELDRPVSDAAPGDRHRPGEGLGPQRLVVGLTGVDLGQMALADEQRRRQPGGQGSEGGLHALAQTGSEGHLDLRTGAVALAQEGEHLGLGWGEGVGHGGTLGPSQRLLAAVPGWCTTTRPTSSGENEAGRAAAARRQWEGHRTVVAYPQGWR